MDRKSTPNSCSTSTLFNFRLRRTWSKRTVQLLRLLYLLEHSPARWPCLVPPRRFAELVNLLDLEITQSKKTNFTFLSFLVFNSALFCVGFSILLVADLKLICLHDHFFSRNSASRIRPRSNGCKHTALSRSLGTSAWDLKLSGCMNVCMSQILFDCNVYVNVFGIIKHWIRLNASRKKTYPVVYRCERAVESQALKTKRRALVACPREARTLKSQTEVAECRSGVQVRQSIAKEKI